MRPDQRWFPTSRTERAAWFNNFTTKFAQIALDLGFSQTDIDEVNADNMVIQFISYTIYQTETYSRAVQAFHQIITLGESSSSTPDFPAFPVRIVPPITRPGIFERLEHLVRRIRVAPGYSPSVGAVLGIIPRAPGPVDLAEAVPNIKATAAAANHRFLVRTTRRKFDGFVIEIRRNRSNVWEPQGKFLRSPAEIAVTPNNPSEPELIDVRIRMIQGNDPVGQYSDIQTITLVP